MKRRNFVFSAACAPLALHGLPVGAQTAAPAASAAAAATEPVVTLHQPTRYAFVADRISRYVSVVDIFTGQHIDNLYFSIRPQVIEMARDDGMLAVGAFEVPEVHFLNLNTRERRVVPLPSPLFQLFFIPQSKLVAVGLRDQVGIINYEDFSVKIFDRRFDSDKRTTPLNTYYSLLFSSFSQSLWVLDEERPFIYHKLGTDPVDSPWKTYDLSRHVKTGSGLGVGIASPEDHMMAFTTDDGSEGLIYYPHEDRALSTGHMRTVGSTNEPMITPYIDAYSKHVIFSDVQGHVALFDLGKGDTQPQRFTVDFSPRVIRSGWLESTWILGGDKGLMFQSFDKPEDRKVFRFPAEVMNIWVTGDSKLALVSLDEGVSQLFRYDIRRREMLDPVRVRGVGMAAVIRMGSNNSICY